MSHKETDLTVNVDNIDDHIEPDDNNSAIYEENLKYKSTNEDKSSL